jgi:hypothetical protein
VKFIGLYQYWQNQKTINLFKAVHTSLRLNITIKSVINIISSRLPKKYFAAHIRLEADKYVDRSSFNNAISDHISFIAHSKCLKPYFLKNTTTFNFSKNAINTIPLYKNKTFPHIYLSSGLFQNNNALKKLVERAERVLYELNKIGFKHITSHLQLLKSNTYGLYPEQFALIDLHISKRSNCFIPSFDDTSFSYVITRFRDWSQNKNKKCCDYILKQYQHQYWEWGFRR